MQILFISHPDFTDTSPVSREVLRLVSETAIVTITFALRAKKLMSAFFDCPDLPDTVYYFSEEEELPAELLGLRGAGYIVKHYRR